MHHTSSSGSTVLQTMGQAFEVLAQEKVISLDLTSRMRKAVGFRSIAVHAFENIDWAIGFKVVNIQLIDFREFAKSFGG